MRLGFVGLEHPRSIRPYSGTPYFMSRALRRYGCEIGFYLQLCEESSAFVQIKDKVIRRLNGKHIVIERDPKIARHYPEQINTAISECPVDAVLGTSSFYMVTRNCNVPSIFWGDTTVAGVLDRYPYYKKLTKKSIRDCHKLEQAALNSSSLAIFSNQWAADVACANYSLDERKVKVIPYGANLFNAPDADEVAECLGQRRERECELLFVGLDWERKGAQIAIDATSVLRARGVRAHLTTVGCVPPFGANLPYYVTVAGRIDKASEDGQRALAELYKRSHFLILPSRAECAAVSLAEASAHGVPSLSTNVGGNSTLVKNGVNGHLFPLEASGVDYADYMLQLLGNYPTYSTMCWSSFERYRAKLNWDVAASRFVAETSIELRLGGGQYACSPAS
jgi:glycosyltransferase involved in cell wall biosynthesis